MRLIDKLATLIGATLNKRPDIRNVLAQNEPGDGVQLRRSLEVAEKRRQALERDLASDGADRSAAEITRLERQLDELERSESQLRSAVGLINAASAQVDTKPATVPPSATSGSQTMDVDTVAAEVPGVAIGVDPEDDIGDRMARLSAPPGVTR